MFLFADTLTYSDTNNEVTMDALTVMLSLLSEAQDNSSPDKRRFFKRVVCADGFTVSVQAAEGSYCSPRNNTGPWSSVECGFPNEKDPVLEAYAEDPSAGTKRTDYKTGEMIETGLVQTVYGWVPSQVVLGILESHGGVVSGELPEMIDEED